MKESFLIYVSFAEAIKFLSVEEKAELLDAMFFYHTNYKEPELVSVPVKIIWSTLKQQFDRDLKKYQNVVERNKANINKRWDSKNTTGKIGIPEDTKNTDTDSETETDTETDTDSETEKNVPTQLQSKSEEIESKKRTRTPKGQPDALQFPFVSVEFMACWNKLVELPKWKKKPLSALQTSLNQLSRYKEEFAIKLIERAHGGNYQGVVFDDTDEKYQRWLNPKKSQNDFEQTKANFAARVAAASTAAKGYN